MSLAVQIFRFFLFLVTFSVSIMIRAKQIGVQRFCWENNVGWTFIWRNHNIEYTSTACQANKSRTNFFLNVPTQNFWEEVTRNNFFCRPSTLKKKCSVIFFWDGISPIFPPLWQNPWCSNTCRRCVNCPGRNLHNFPIHQSASSYR
jgi:hypothetical protein